MFAFELSTFTLELLAKSVTLSPSHSTPRISRDESVILPGFAPVSGTGV
jgi:hypothetical protein